MSWIVLHLRPRCEKKFDTLCAGLDISHYLPLREEIKIYQRRKVRVEKPVFPGYFFLSLNDENRNRILGTNQVIRIMKPSSERILLHQLAQVRKALRIDTSLGTVNALTEGQHVRIKAGPFMGVEGIVESFKKNRTVVRLNVDLVGRAVAVEAESAFIEPIDSDAIHTARR